MIDSQKYLALAFWIYAFMFGQISSGEKGRKRYKRLTGFPRPWVFMVVWTTLNMCLGVAAWETLRHTMHYSGEAHYVATFALWLAYLITLKMWSPAFDASWRVWPLVVCIAALALSLSLVGMASSRFAYSASSFDVIWPFIILVLGSAWHVYAVYLAALIREREPAIDS